MKLRVTPEGETLYLKYEAETEGEKAVLEVIRRNVLWGKLQDTASYTIPGPGRLDVFLPLVTLTGFLTDLPEDPGT